MNILWGLGIGDWGLGDWAQSPIPNPQSPIPRYIHKIIIFIIIIITITTSFNYNNNEILISKRWSFFLISITENLNTHESKIYKTNDRFRYREYEK